MREYDINPDLLDMSQSTEVFHKGWIHGSLS